MKHIILSLLVLFSATGASAQGLCVYNKVTKLLVDGYKASEANKAVLSEGNIDSLAMGHEYVEIGGTKWATMNLGATSVADDVATAYGDFYAWGETDTYYSSLSGRNVTFGKTSDKTHIPGEKTAYNWMNYSNDAHFIEWDPVPYNSNYTLLDNNDAAQAAWGGAWRMPTVTDFENLDKACGGTGYVDKTIKTFEGDEIAEGGRYWIEAGSEIDGTTYEVNGLLFVATDDISKRVFFPAAGLLEATSHLSIGKYGYYWASTLYKSDENSGECFFFASTDTHPQYVTSRYRGCCVRPVLRSEVIEIYNNDTRVASYNNTPSHEYEVLCTEPRSKNMINGHEYVEIAGKKWATMNVGATNPTECYNETYGDFYAWGEIDTYYKSYTDNSVTYGKYSDKTHIKGVKTNYDMANYCGAKSSDPDDLVEWYPVPYNDNHVLKPEYDVAHVKWGGTWRMPTLKEFEDLLKACSREPNADLTQFDGINPFNMDKGGKYWISGWKLIDGVYYGPRGVLLVSVDDISKRVFFPAVGICYADIERGSTNSYLGYYWTSEVDTWGNADLPAAQHGYAKSFGFYFYVEDDEFVYKMELQRFRRYAGNPVRPISD